MAPRESVSTGAPTTGASGSTPHVFRGLWCRCGAQHHQAASYYVSVADAGRVVLAAGPYPEHDQALAMVEPVRELVQARYNPNGRAHWFGFGTTAMRPSYTEPGKLTAELASWPPAPETTTPPRRATQRRRQAVKETVRAEA